MSIVKPYPATARWTFSSTVSGYERTVPLALYWEPDGSAMSDDYTPESSRFTGSIAWVQLDIGPDDHDHLITAADQWRVAMARQ